MVINKTSSYALRILLFMSNNESESYSAAYLFEKLKISHEYIRRILNEMSKSGIIKSIKGRNGGFVFAKPLNEIYLAEIIQVFEDVKSFEKCILGIDDCKNIEKCSIHDIWEAAQEKIISIFNNKTLFELKQSGLTNF